MLSSADRLRVAAGKLFTDVDLIDIEDLIDSCARVDVPRGERLLEAGSSNYRLYLVLAGELNVYPGGPGLPRHTTLAAGDCAGEMSLIDGSPVSALVVAARDCELLAIPHKTLWSMVERAPLIARNLLATLTGRVRHDNAMLIASQVRNHELEMLMRVDPVTGLPNHRWMERSFPRAMSRCMRDGEPASLALADIDHFTHFNQQLGSSAGDAMARMVATQLANGLRTYDLLARRRDGSFAMLLPRATVDQGCWIAERLRSIVATSRASGAAVAPRVTLSFGVAPLSDNVSLDILIGNAAEALQAAKANGRNRTEPTLA